MTVRRQTGGTAGRRVNTAGAEPFLSTNPGEGVMRRYSAAALRQSELRCINFRANSLIFHKNLHWPGRRLFLY
jgi:hypothetical protein